MLDLICEIDGENRFKSVNPACEYQLGYDAGELLDTPLLDLVHPDEHAATQRALRALRESGRLVDFIHRLRGKRGDYRWLEWRATYAAGRGILAVGRDVTDREHHQRSSEAEARLHDARRLESLSLLAGGVAHDFNNLLMSILGNADHLLSQLPKYDERHAVTEEIISASKRAADLCKQLLAYSGKGQRSVEPINLSEMIISLGPLLSTSVSTSTTLEYALPKSLPSINADATQLKQIFLNLVINASDALEDGKGIVTISTGTMYCDRRMLQRNAPADELEEGQYAYCEITDTGPGVDQGMRSRIFEPFFSTKFTGRGLGLAAVQGITRAHRGLVTVTTAPGKGAAFRVLFPISTVVKKRPAKQFKWRGEGKILVVDDQENVRIVASRILENGGFEPLMACDGQDGVQRFGQHAKELKAVLLDITMPVMNGERAFVEMRKLEPSVPILLTSGYAANKGIEQLLNEPRSRFIQKPYTSSELLAALRALIDP